MKPIDDIQILISEALSHDKLIDVDQMAQIAHKLHPNVPLEELRATVVEIRSSIMHRRQWPKASPHSL